MKIKIKEKRGRGRLKQRWLNTIENNMRVNGVCAGDFENWDKWGFRTRMADSKQLGKSKEEFLS